MSQTGRLLRGPGVERENVVEYCLIDNDIEHLMTALDARVGQRMGSQLMETAAQLTATTALLRDIAALLADIEALVVF